MITMFFWDTGGGFGRAWKSTGQLEMVAEIKMAAYCHFFLSPLCPHFITEVQMTKGK